MPLIYEPDMPDRWICQSCRFYTVGMWRKAPDVCSGARIWWDCPVIEVAKIVMVPIKHLVWLKEHNIQRKREMANGPFCFAFTSLPIHSSRCFVGEVFTVQDQSFCCYTMLSSVWWWISLCYFLPQVLMFFPSAASSTSEIWKSVESVKCEMQPTRPLIYCLFVCSAISFIPPAREKKTTLIKFCMAFFWPWKPLQRGTQSRFIKLQQVPFNMIRPKAKWSTIHSITETPWKWFFSDLDILPICPTFSRHLKVRMEINENMNGLCPTFHPFSVSQINGKLWKGSEVASG